MSRKNGSFSTLLIGTILKQIGSFISNLWVGKLLIMLGTIGTVMTGVGIAVGVAHQLQASKLVLYSSIVNGIVGAYGAKLVSEAMINGSEVILSGPRDPLGTFIGAVVGVEVERLVAGKTKLDILLTPAVTIFSGSVLAYLIGTSLSQFTALLSQLIKSAMTLQPFLMGMVVSNVMGIFLTLPISSAAIGVILDLSGIVGGAATAGCTAQMIGFAVMSYRENVATGSGMGTAGLVGPLLMWQAMSDKGVSAGPLLIEILLVCFILPGVLTYIFAEFLRKINWIKPNDLKRDL